MFKLLSVDRGRGLGFSARQCKMRLNLWCWYLGQHSRIWIGFLSNLGGFCDMKGDACPY